MQSILILISKAPERWSGGYLHIKISHYKLPMQDQGEQTRGKGTGADTATEFLWS